MDTQSRQVPARSSPGGEKRQVHRTEDGQKPDFHRDAVREVEWLTHHNTKPISICDELLLKRDGHMRKLIFSLSLQKRVSSTLQNIADSLVNLRILQRATIILEDAFIIRSDNNLF